VVRSAFVSQECPLPKTQRSPLGLDLSDCPSRRRRFTWPTVNSCIIRDVVVYIKMELSPSRRNILAIISLLLIAPSAHAQQAQSQSALVKQYCVGCHNQKVTTAVVSLQGLDLNKVGDHASVWERALRKVRSGQMPPTGLPRPDATATASFTKWLENSLNEAAAANPNPGRPAVHRLNRAEYSNAIRDLLAVDIRSEE